MLMLQSMESDLQTLSVHVVGLFVLESSAKRVT